MNEINENNELTEEKQRKLEEEFGNVVDTIINDV
jgi:hypothetical protein